MKSIRKDIPVFVFFLFCSLSLMPQNKIPGKKLESPQGEYFKIKTDSGHVEVDFINALAESGQKIDNVNRQNYFSWDLKKTKSDADVDRMVLKTLRNIFNNSFHIDYRNLTLYRSILDDMQNDNDDFENAISDQKTTLLQLKKQLDDIPKDTTIVKLIANLNGNERLNRGLNRLNTKWLNAYTIVKQNIDTVSNWEKSASIRDIVLENMREKMDSLTIQKWQLLLKGGKKTAHPKFNPAAFSKSMKIRADAENRMLSYVMKDSAGKIIFIPLLVAVLIGIWVFMNRLKIKKAAPDLLAGAYFVYLRNFWWAAPLILVFSFIHIIDIHAPWEYLLSIQIVLAAVSCYIIFKEHDKYLAYTLLGSIAVLIGITLIANMPPGGFNTISIVFLSLVQMFVIALMIRKEKFFIKMQNILRFILSLCMLLCLFSIFSCLTKRTELSFILLNAASFGVLQIITLTLFKQILTETLLLQLTAARVKLGVLRPIRPDILDADLHIPGIIVILYMWFCMAANNLNVYDPISQLFKKLFSDHFTVGSISFSIIGVLLFFVIIWLANSVQKYVGYFFGDTTLEEDENLKKQRSRMLAMKIVVLTVGYFMAIIASGMPLDKITIIIGALGVGVGMGLQNIVNNFISGIILIFDRPLQIGDTIEVKGVSGKVKEIGIRTTTILSWEGSEIIVPNGDILSNVISNWTHSDKKKRITLHFKLVTDKDTDVIKKIIRDAVEDYNLLSKHNKPEVILEQVNDAEKDIRVYLWCNNISTSETVESRTRLLIYEAFKKNDIIII